MSTDNAFLPVVMSLENPVFAGKGGITRRKGGSGLIKRNLLEGAGDHRNSGYDRGVGTLYDRAPPVYICAVR